MSLNGLSIAVKGDVWSAADLNVDGRIDGAIWCEEHAVVIGKAARTRGDIIARDITVFGTVDGQLIATDVVDLRPGSRVTGVIISPSFVLHDGATFNGRAEPKQLEAALSVAKFQLKQKGNAASG